MRSIRVGLIPKFLTGIKCRISLCRLLPQSPSLNLSRPQHPFHLPSPHLSLHLLLSQSLLMLQLSHSLSLVLRLKLKPKTRLSQRRQSLPALLNYSKRLNKQLLIRQLKLPKRLPQPLRPHLLTQQKLLLPPPLLLLMLPKLLLPLLQPQQLLLSQQSLILKKLMQQKLPRPQRLVSQRRKHHRSLVKPLS